MGALKRASDGIDGVLQDVRAQKVGGIDPDADAVGHDKLAESLSDFTDRWQRGVANPNFRQVRQGIAVLTCGGLT